MIQNIDLELDNKEFKKIAAIFLNLKMEDLHGVKQITLKRKPSPLPQVNIISTKKVIPDIDVYLPDVEIELPVMEINVSQIKKALDKLEHDLNDYNSGGEGR